MKKKMLIFHPAIAPYRIQFFNMIDKAFDVTVCLYYRNLKSQKFDYKSIEKQFDFVPHYFDKSIRLGRRTLYLGHKKWIKQQKPDAVIVSEYGLGLWVAVLSRLLASKRYKIFTICDDSEEMAQNRIGLRKVARDIAVKHLDGIILCNTNAAEWYSKYNVPIFIFPIIQDEEDFNSGKEIALEKANYLFQKYGLDGKRLFLFVGRLSPEKNLHYLVKSFIQQHNDYPENTLFLVGGASKADPDLGAEIQRIINESNAGQYIKLVGRYEGVDLKAWYHLGQILILPSKQEAFGAVVNEALLAGEYVMVSKSAGASCLVNETNGAVIDVTRPSIDFSQISKTVSPLHVKIIPRESKMQFKFDQKMTELLEWFDNTI